MQTAQKENYEKQNRRFHTNVNHIELHGVMSTFSRTTPVCVCVFQRISKNNCNDGTQAKTAVNLAKASDETNKRPKAIESKKQAVQSAY